MSSFVNFISTAININKQHFGIYPLIQTGPKRFASSDVEILLKTFKNDRDNSLGPEVPYHFR